MMIVMNFIEVHIENKIVISSNLVTNCFHCSQMTILFMHTCNSIPQLILLQTVRFFIWDQIKQVLVKLVLMPPIIAGLLFFIRWGGEYFYMYTWLFVFAVTMVSSRVCMCVCVCVCVCV